MIISIHQPNLCPWVPFFEKMRDADILCILINCQFEKNGYQNRFNIGNSWYTMSVKKGLVNIADKQYVKPHEDWAKIKGKLPHYKKAMDLFDDCISDNLSLTNSKIIIKAAAVLGIKTRVVFDEPMPEKSTDRLIKIVQAHNCTKYIAGSGGKAYLDYNKFAAAGIEVINQDLSKCRKTHLFEALMERL